MDWIESPEHKKTWFDFSTSFDDFLVSISCCPERHLKNTLKNDLFSLPRGCRSTHRTLNFYCKYSCMLWTRKKILEASSQSYYKDRVCSSDILTCYAMESWSVLLLVLTRRSLCEKIFPKKRFTLDVRIQQKKRNEKILNIRRDIACTRWPIRFWVFSSYFTKEIPL